MHVCFHFGIFSVSAHKHSATPYTQYYVHMFTCNCDSPWCPIIDVHFSISFLQGERPIISLKDKFSYSRTSSKNTNINFCINTVFPPNSDVFNHHIVA